MNDRPLRLWPGLAAVALQWIAWVVVPILDPGPAAGYARPLGAVFGAVVVLVWWAFFSRAPKLDRWIGVGLIVASIAVVGRFVHESLSSGMMSVVFVFNVLPPLCFAFVACAAMTRSLADGPRRAALITVILASVGGWLLLRSDGMRGDGVLDLAWRWSETAEQRLEAAAGSEPPPAAPVEPAVQIDSPAPAPAAEPPPAKTALAPDAPIAAAPTPEWPGFRGPKRDGVVRGVRIETDWNASPPVELWRRPVGPGWSSFAVQGDRLCTQEQRGDEEAVSCHDLHTGALVWRHTDPARFWEAIGGPGPRATPTVHEGRVYALGATGVLNALNAADGSVVWSRNVGTDADVAVPGWGFSASPLVVGDVLVAAAEGRLIGYALESGELLWLGPQAGFSYSSPHFFVLDGVPQVVLMSTSGATSVDPADGSVLWRRSLIEKSRIVQPAMTSDFDLLVSDGESAGIRRLAVARTGEAWTTEDRWDSFRLKPYFNDFVIYQGRAVGFDGRILAAVDLDDGSLLWKGGRYGQGQMILLADQGLLLVVSEDGEAALVDAAADRFVELARAPLLSGKTWNHPALAGEVLLVRNGEEMAAFRLAPLTH